MTKTLHSLHLNIVSYCELSILHKWMQVISNGNYSIRYIFLNTQLQNGQSIGPVSPTTAVIVCPLSCFVTKTGVTLLTFWLVFCGLFFNEQSKQHNFFPQVKTHQYTYPQRKKFLKYVRNISIGLKMSLEPFFLICPQNRLC